jgi:diketogulonate reductase-like aldo/keto reductase
MAATAPVPGFLYGTAWKEEATRGLTLAALRAGFRGIDTANQRKHYHEAAVGAGLADAIAAGVVTRDEVFLQTKFTHRRSQDDRLPYDPAAPVADQVAQSFRSSLNHLKTDRIDSYVLHGPSTRNGLAPQDWEAWRSMETLFDEGRIGRLGVSNVTANQLDLLCREARIKPAFVQNRCYAVQAWDLPTRRVCRNHGVNYQGFSLLTANRTVLSAAVVRRVGARLGVGPAQVIFAFARTLGMITLTGTTNPNHMAEDLAVADVRLTTEETAAIEKVALKSKSAQ